MLPFVPWVLFSLMIFPTPAQPREQVLTSTLWLGAHLGDPDLVLLHVGQRGGYDRAHIPGARLLEPDVLRWDEDGLSVQMLPPDLLPERLAALGISPS